MLRLAAALLCAGTMAARAGSGFAIDIAFDEGAQTDLAARGEWVTVSVLLYGTPNAEGQAQADEMGQVFLGSEQITVRPVTQRVQVAGNVDQEALARWVTGSAVRANVNVFSARFTDENNLLDCGIFEDDVGVAQADVPRIDCGLLAQ
jgi:hypothetical protein